MSDGIEVCQSAAFRLLCAQMGYVEIHIDLTTLKILNLKNMLTLE